MITLKQPSLVLNSYGILDPGNYGYSMWRTWNMPKSATSKDVANWIAIACDQSPELQLHHVIIHAHGGDGYIVVGEDAAGNDNSITMWNVADFQPLASKDIGCIWLHACNPAGTKRGTRFCSKLAASSGTTVVASADVQYSVGAILGTLFMPAGKLDDYEGRVYQFNADGSSFWPITPNGGTFSGPPTVNRSKR